MQIRLTKGKSLGAGRNAYAGDVIEAPGDISIDIARQWVAKGDALEIKAGPTPASEETMRPVEGDDDEAIEKSEVVIKTRDPKATHRAPRRKRG